MRIEVCPQVVSRDVPEACARRTVAQDDRAGGRCCGGIADLRGRVRVGDRGLAREVRYQSGDVSLRVRVCGRSLARQRRHQPGHISLSMGVGERSLAGKIGHEIRHVGFSMDVRRDRRERNRDVNAVAAGHVQERKPDVRALDQVQRAPGADCRPVVLDRERQRSGDDIGGNVGAPLWS